MCNIFKFLNHFLVFFLKAKVWKFNTTILINRRYSLFCLSSKTLFVGAKNFYVYVLLLYTYNNDILKSNVFGKN